MYMPLCRECHARESAANQGNIYEGDPSIVDVKVEESESSSMHKTHLEKSNETTASSQSDSAVKEGARNATKASPLLKIYSQVASDSTDKSSDNDA